MRKSAQFFKEDNSIFDQEDQSIKSVLSETQQKCANNLNGSIKPCSLDWRMNILCKSTLFMPNYGNFYNK